MNELSVADAVEGTGKFGDFIIPLRIGNIAFADIPIQIHNKNAIDFTEGWHIGLAKLLKKLEKDEVPRREEVLEASLSHWAKTFLGLDGGMVTQPEVVMSNWLPVTTLPEMLRISTFSLTPKSISALQAQWPCRLEGYRLLSFADVADFDFPLSEDWNLRKEVEVKTSDFLKDGVGCLSQLSYQDRSNILTDLMRQAWELFAQSNHLHAFEMASGHLAWYFQKPEGRIERTKFVDALGKTGQRALLGESKKLNVFWHLAMEFQPIAGPKSRYTLLTHVIFTSNGIDVVGDAKRMHMLRRRFCKQWWQDRWRDLTSAYLAHIADGNTALALPAAPGKSILVSVIPLTYASPVVSVEQGGETNSAEENIDDADILFDEKADVEGDFVDEEVEET